MSLKTIEELRAEHEAEIRDLELKHRIVASLPDGIGESSICVHSDHISVTYSKKRFPERYSFIEAFEIFGRFTKVESEHWRDGCLSCRPAEINKSSKKESAVLDGTSIAEVSISAGQGFDSHKLSFWARVSDRLVHVSVEIRPEYQWLPDVKFHFDSHGNCSTVRCNAKSLGEDSRTKWWSPPGSYQISYYWADEHSFAAFASCAAWKR